MEKKKILIVGPAYPYRGGNSLFVSHLYDLLKEQFETVIYNYTLLYPSLLFPGTTQYDNSAETILKAPSRRIVNSINPFNWLYAAQEIVKERADLVIFDWWHPFFAPCHFAITAFIKKKYQGRIVFITENFISHEGSPVDRMLTRLGLRFADHFITLSEKVAGDIAKTFPKKPVHKSELPVYDCYLSASAENDKAKFGFAPDAKVLLFFGYIRKYKGLDLLIRALPEMIARDDTIRLLAVGESYDDISIYENLISELRMEKFIRLENVFVANEDVWKYYSVADVVVLPYRSATQSGILNVAYGFLKPVIVTDVGGLSEFVDEGKTGFIIEPESTHALAGAVLKFYDRKDAIPFSRHIREKAQQNRFYKIPEMLREIISAIV